MPMPDAGSILCRKARAVCSCSVASQQHRNALTAADAQRDEPELVVAALHLVEDLRRDRGAGGGDRVPERDRAAVRVDLVGVETEPVDDGEGLGGERLVELDHADLVK